MAVNICIKVVDGLTCPKCGAGEMHPDGEHCLIRAFKVEMGDGHWWSECLVCAGYYNEDLTLKPRKDGEWYPEGYDHKAGWF